MYSKLSVLIIEDDINVNNLLSSIIKKEKYPTRQCFSGASGLECIREWNPSLLLLDLLLPDMTGMDIIREVRKFSSIPIIVISALHTEQSKVLALDLGADDYICKPFGHCELMARIRAAYRHNIRSSEEIMTYQVGDLFIDFENHEIYKDSKKLRLTPIEFKLISLLAKHSGQVMTNAFIMTEIWGPYVTPDNGIIRVNIANIRRKIEQNPADPQYIITETGLGYRMLEE